MTVPYSEISLHDLLFLLLKYAFILVFGGVGGDSKDRECVIVACFLYQELL